MVRRCVGSHEGPVVGLMIEVRPFVKGIVNQLYSYVGRRLVVYSVFCAVWLVLSFFLGTCVRAFRAWHVAVVSAFMALSSCRLVP
jgi:hypothetical protein